MDFCHKLRRDLPLFVFVLCRKRYSYSHALKGEGGNQWKRGVKLAQHFSSIGDSGRFPQKSRFRNVRLKFPQTVFLKLAIETTLFVMAKNLNTYPRQARWIVFALAIPISLYVSYFGTIFMGFCPGFECWPHSFAWMLLTPCLVLTIWSLRATAIAAVLLLSAHVYTDVDVYRGGLSANTLWGTDKALDKCLWIVVFLLVISALLPGRLPPKNQISN